MMESGPRSQDVNVYITVDSASLQNHLNSTRRSRQLKLSSLIADLGLSEYLRQFCTPLGWLLIFETILALMLVLLSTIPPNYRMGYGAAVYAIIANFITLATFLLHIAIVCCHSSIVSQQRVTVTFILALKISTRFILLILQVIAFIVMIACHRGYGEQTAFIIITFVYCCVLIVAIFFYKEEYLRCTNTKGSTSVTKKQRLRRRKQKGYKVLSKSGYR